MEYIIILQVFWAIYGKQEIAYIGAIIAGVIVDLWLGKPFGITSFGLLLLSFIITIYKRKFNAYSIWFFSVFVFISLLSYVVLIKGISHFSVGYGIRLLVTVSSTLFMLIIGKYLWEHQRISKKQFN